MAAPTLPHTITPNTVNDAVQVQENFDALLDAITDGNSDLTINDLTANDITANDVNASTGAIKTAGTNRIDNSGNIVNGGTATFSGNVTTSAGNFDATSGTYKIGGTDVIDATRKVFANSLELDSDSTIQGGRVLDRIDFSFKSGITLTTVYQGFAEQENGPPAALIWPKSFLGGAVYLRVDYTGTGVVGLTMDFKIEDVVGATTIFEKLGISVGNPSTNEIQRFFLLVDSGNDTDLDLTTTDLKHINATSSNDWQFEARTSANQSIEIKKIEFIRIT